MTPRRSKANERKGQQEVLDSEESFDDDDEPVEYMDGEPDNDEKGDPALRDTWSMTSTHAEAYAAAGVDAINLVSRSARPSFSSSRGSPSMYSTDSTESQ